jgi:tetratricopeptide (TPR) repeat protein
MAQYMLGEEDSARVALQKAVEAGTDFAGKEEARARLAVLAIDPRNADASKRAELDNYLRQQPTDPGALARLAQLQQRDGKPDQAINTYERIIATDPVYAPGTRELAILYGERPGETAKAYDFAQKARQAYPGDAEVAMTLGILSYRRDLYLRAVELLTEASAKRKDNAELLYYLGQARYQPKQWNECKATLEKAIGLRLPANLAGEATRALAECIENVPQQP